MKNNDWGFLNLEGKKATGQEVLNFIKEAFCSRLGFIYEYKRAYKYVGFADQEDFIEWYTNVLETIDSKNPEIIQNNLSYSKIVEVWELPKSGVGYIWEGLENDGEDYYGKFFGFIDEDKYLEWVQEGKPLLSDLIQLSWVSFRPRIVALEGLRSLLLRDNQLFLEQIALYNLNFRTEINLTINNNVLGYVYEDHEHGKFLGFATEETYNEWHNSGESPLSDLILLKWNNSKEQGIPIYTKTWADNLVNSEGDYIVIPDEDDINNSNVENHTYDTSINGPLANILFSAIRLLLSEIAKLKNTFDYGIHSYSGTDTAMSRVEHGYSDYDEEEPLWAVDEEELSLVKEVILGLFHTFDPSSNVDASEEGVLKFNQSGASWFDDGDIAEVSDPKLFIYITSNGQNIQVKLISGASLLNIDLNSLNIPNIELYDILVVISRKQTIESVEKGNLFIWISVSNRYTDETILEGYYKNGSVYPSELFLDKNYTIQGLTFKNLTLSKLSIYSKYQDFSRQVIPSKPSDEGYAYKTAHITIRSVNTYETLNSIKDLLPENELIYVEDSKTLYIKNNYKLNLISGGGTQPSNPDNPDNPPIDDSGMTQQEILQLLRSMGISTDELNNLNLSSDVVFVHQDTGIKFKLRIDSEGNLTTSKISDNTLAQKIKTAFGTNATSVGDDNRIRGFVGRLGLATLNVERASNESAMTELSDIKLYSDRIKIGSFYAPASTNTAFGCSHCFIELENTSDKDFPLDGCYLHLCRNVNNVPTTYHLALKGMIPAGGTFLIRGAKKAEFDDPNTFIKVLSFDQEWYIDGQLMDFSHNGEVTVDNKGNQIGNDPHGLALTYGYADLEYNTLLWFSNSAAGDSKASYLYDPSYIDSLYYNATFNTGNSAYWTTKNERMYLIKDGVFLDCIYKNTFELDPAKQAYQSLNTYDSSRCRHLSTADYLYLYLGKEFIEFPKTSEKCPVSKFTPKASYEHKNVSTDKTLLDVEKPNMVTCSFGKNPYTTRCFNWVSGGLFDEYVFIKQGASWIKFESYKAGDESKTLEDGALKRKEFNNADIINCVYKRMTGRFPAANTQYTSHKCIINVYDPAYYLDIQSPIEYTYMVGRADKNGNPDLEHCSEEYTFTLYPASYTPRIYLITDLQGFHWVEYQAWAAAAEVINDLINTEKLAENIIPVLINTGDMTLSGSRINEWIDYYNAGKSLFSHLELMNVVGNNDLCGNDFTILGTGDDEGKANSYYFHVFYCYEVETGQGMVPIINNKYVPSLYRVLFDDYLLLAVNSEITSVNCRGWFNATLGNDVVNIYTGWTVPSEGSPQYVNSFTSIYTMIYNMTDLHNGNYIHPDREIIAICHEMPFTVITAENLENTPTIKGRWRSLSGASSLVGSHLNQLTVKDTVGTHWFSRLLEFRNCKLCIGGHKHTYAVTYPLMENYIYGASNSKDNGPMTMTQTLENDNVVSWISEGRNLSKFPLTTRTLPAASSTTFYPSEHVDNFYNNRKGVIYFMCQATGFKLMSNKELPSPDLTFSQYIPKSSITRDSNTNAITKSSASSELRYPMYAVIELGSTWNITLTRLANIQVNPTTLFTLVAHGTNPVEKQYLYDNSEELGDNVWRYGGWSNVKRTLLQIS